MLPGRTGRGTAPGEACQIGQGPKIQLGRGPAGIRAPKGSWGGGPAGCQGRPLQHHIIRG